MAVSTTARGMWFVAALALLSSCARVPSVFVLHAPIQPNNTQTVTYTATARDAEGVTSIQIWEYRNRLVLCSNGMQCATPISTSVVRTCTFSPPLTEAACTFTTAASYPDSSFIGYRAIARNTANNTAQDGWIYFAAGAFPWPNNPIPVYARGAPAEKIDLIFIPDSGYGNNNNQFMLDATSLVTNAYLATATFAEEIRPRRGFWNFYVTYQQGQARGFGSGCNTAPANWTNLRTIVNSGGILHNQNIRDCAGVGDGSLFSVRMGRQFTNPTAIHETGHSVFSLADEYCCDGGYWQTNPHPNVFSSQANCTANATSNGWPTTDCLQIGTTGWWRSDPNEDLMRQNNSNANPFARADRRRIQWLYFEQCLGSAGC